MAFNPLDNTTQQPINNDKKFTGSAPANKNERNDYGHGLAEDTEIKYLYFRDRKKYIPAKPFQNEPPENAFAKENHESIIPQDDVDYVPDFDTPPPDAYLSDAPGLESINGDDFWVDSPPDYSDIPNDVNDNLPPQDFNQFEESNFNSNLPNDSHETSDKTHHESSNLSNEQPKNYQPNNNNVDNNSSQNKKTNEKSDSDGNDAKNEEPKKSKYNYAKLESVPLPFLLLHMGADPIHNKKNLYTFYDQTININDHRWYNQTFNRGFEGAISLCKEMFAIKERIDPFKNSKILGGKACKYLEGVFADYIKQYKHEPPVIEKKTNYQKPNDEKVERPSKDNLYSYIKFDYNKFNPEEKSTYFSLLECLHFDNVAKLFDMSIDSNEYSLTHNNKKLVVHVNDRSWKVKFDKQEKFGIGTLNFAALIMSFKESQNFFDKEVFKTYRMNSSKFLSANIKESDIDKESFDLETMEINKEDPSYLYKVPYHRLDKEDQTKYFQGIENFPLDRLASMLGASDYEDGKADQWKFHETFMTENVKIDVAENRWKSWNSDGGGTGAISLMTYYLMAKDGADFYNPTTRKEYRFDAARFISTHMSGEDISFERKGALKSEVFTMPIILEPKNPHVKEYLCEKRQLPQWVVQKQMNAGFLFAGYPAHWKEIPKLKTPEFMPNDLVWATFLTISGQAAEMRGIARSDHNAKILAKGSEKDLGGFLTKAEPKYNEYTVCSFEASIDSLSYHAIYPGRITQSCMGTEYKLAAKAGADILKVTAVKTKHSCCFDNDFAGIKATIRYFHHLKELMRDEDVYEEMLEKKQQNPDYVAPDEVLYKDFINAYKDGRINMFELTVKDLEEFLAQNKTFYLDVLEDRIGLEAAKIFYQIASNTLGKEVVKKAYGSGQFKYMNVLPTPKALEVNLVETTAQTLDKLLSNHNYYLEMPDIESYYTKDGDEEFNGLSDEEKSEAMSRTKKVLTAFYHEFEKQAGNKLKTLVDNGSVIYERQTLFKDWNEHLIYMKNTHPEFAKMLADREVEFSHYSSPDAPKVKPGKIKK